MPRASTSAVLPVLTGGPLTWRPTKKMNVRDLSNDDDFLSHLLVEKLGTGIVPLLVHKMDQSKRLPKTSAKELLAIVRMFVTFKGPLHVASKRAVDELLRLDGVRYYLRSYTQKQINAFATHASRYLEFYMPTGSIEIAHTSRYSHVTGKSELCILATRPLPVGAVVTELKGSMADLSPEEERRLKHGDARSAGLGVRKDFSVIHSKQKKMNHLFLGPARFVNHDCENNSELFRDGRYITFRVIREIAVGEEVTTHYGDGYFGSKNKHCLCATCERKGRGGYSLNRDEDGLDSQQVSDSDESSSSSASEEEAVDVNVNVNERRTRRGVYHVVPEEEDSGGEDSDDEIVEAVDPSEVPSPTPEPTTASVVTNLAVPTPPRSTSSSLTPLSTSSLAAPSAMSLPAHRSSSHQPSPLSSLPSITSDLPSSPISFLSSVEAGETNEFAKSPSSQTAHLPTPAASQGTPDDTGSCVSSTTAVTVTRMTRTSVVIFSKSDAKDSIKTESSPSPAPDALPTRNHLQTKPRRRPANNETLLHHTKEETLRDLQKEDTPGNTEADEEDVEEEESEREEAPRRTLRAGKDRPPKFYDDTKRRAPRKKKGQFQEKPKIVVEEAVVEDVREERSTRRRSGPPKKDKALVSREPPAAVQEVIPERQVEEEEDLGLPKCKTCLSVVPVIKVDGQVVWDGEQEDGDIECPRCMRHIAIYGLRWPHRFAKHGNSMLPTPREDTPLDTVSVRKITKKALTVLDSKLAAAAVSSVTVGVRRARSTHTEVEEPPKKRARADQAAVPVPLKVVASATESIKTARGRTTSLSARESVVAHSRSGRAQVPSFKARSIEPSIKRKPGRPRKYAVPLEKDLPRPRGRPRKRPLTPAADAEEHEDSSADEEQYSFSSPERGRSTSVKPLEGYMPERSSSVEVVEEDYISVHSRSPSVEEVFLSPSRTRFLRRRSFAMNLKTLAVGRQPRDGNGRFGKKPETNGIHARKKVISGRQRAQRAQARSRQRDGEPGDSESEEEAGYWYSDDEDVDVARSPSRPLGSSPVWPATFYSNGSKVPSTVSVSADKRMRAVEEQTTEPPAKKTRLQASPVVKVEVLDDDVISFSSSVKVEAPPSRRPGLGIPVRLGLKPVGGLLCRPNPSAFRIRTARPSFPVDSGADVRVGARDEEATNAVPEGGVSDSESASASADPSMTPADDPAPEPVVIGADEVSEEEEAIVLATSISVSPKGVSAKMFLAKTARVSTAWKPLWKPSPHNWARRRFPQPVEAAGDDNNEQPLPAPTYPPSREFSTLSETPPKYAKTPLPSPSVSPPSQFARIPPNANIVYKPSSYVKSLASPKLVRAGWDADHDSVSDALSD